MYPFSSNSHVGYGSHVPLPAGQCSACTNQVPDREEADKLPRFCSDACKTRFVAQRQIRIDAPVPVHIHKSPTDWPKPKPDADADADAERAEFAQRLADESGGTVVHRGRVYEPAPPTEARLAAAAAAATTAAVSFASVGIEAGRVSAAFKRLVASLRKGQR